jgi:hypothetical protein
MSPRMLLDRLFRREDLDRSMGEEIQFGSMRPTYADLGYRLGRPSGVRKSSLARQRTTRSFAAKRGASTACTHLLPISVSDYGCSAAARDFRRWRFCVWLRASVRTPPCSVGSKGFYFVLTPRSHIRSGCSRRNCSLCEDSFVSKITASNDKKCGDLLVIGTFSTARPGGRRRAAGH